MKYQRYEYQTEDELHYFEFTSIGSKGEIKKIVEYTKVSIDNIHILCFGDYDKEGNRIDDKIVTNNGDSQKVLATVVSTLYAFMGNILNLGFLRQEAQRLELDYTEWELQII